MRKTTLMTLGLGLAAVAPLAVGCGADAGTADEVASLKSKLDVQQSEMAALDERMLELESRNRSLEERLEAVNARPAPATVADASVSEETPAGEGGMTTDAGDLAAKLESTEAKEKIEAVIAEVREKEREEERARRSERMTQWITDRVNNQLATELNLDEVQKSKMVEIMTDASTRIGEMWSDMRNQRDNPNAMADARTKMNDIRKEAEDQIAQALTVDQFEKFQDGGGMMGGFGRRGGDRGGNNSGNRRNR